MLFNKILINILKSYEHSIFEIVKKSIACILYKTKYIYLYANDAFIGGFKGGVGRGQQSITPPPS